jgi:hypothetical protein
MMPTNRRTVERLERAKAFPPVPSLREELAYQRAIELVAEHNRACTNMYHTNPRNAKKAQGELDRSVKALLAALTGKKPTKEQIAKAQS